MNKESQSQFVSFALRVPLTIPSVERVFENFNIQYTYGEMDEEARIDDPIVYVGFTNLGTLAAMQDFLKQISREEAKITNKTSVTEMSEHKGGSLIFSMDKNKSTKPWELIPLGVIEESNHRLS